MVSLNSKWHMLLGGGTLRIYLLHVVIFLFLRSICTFFTTTLNKTKEIQYQTWHHLRWVMANEDQFDPNLLHLPLSSQPSAIKFSSQNGFHVKPLHTDMYFSPTHIYTKVFLIDIAHPNFWLPQPLQLSMSWQQQYRRWCHRRSILPHLINPTSSSHPKLRRKHSWQCRQRYVLPVCERGRSLIDI